MSSGDRENKDSSQTKSAFEPRFRALTVDGRRRGVRLEQVYWSAIQEILSHENMTFSDLVVQLEADHPEAPNLTSLLRVHAMNWSMENLHVLRERTSIDEITKLVDACPTPAFVLSSNKRLRTYNNGFINFVRSHFAGLDSGSISVGLRLQIDVSTEDLINKLRTSGDRFMPVGFVIGLENRRVRGRISAVLAPAWDADYIIGYVTA